MRKRKRESRRTKKKKTKTNGYGCCFVLICLGLGPWLPFYLCLHCPSSSSSHHHRDRRRFVPPGLQPRLPYRPSLCPFEPAPRPSLRPAPPALVSASPQLVPGQTPRLPGSLLRCRTPSSFGRLRGPSQRRQGGRRMKRRTKKGGVAQERSEEVRRQHHRPRLQHHRHPRPPSASASPALPHSLSAAWLAERRSERRFRPGSSPSPRVVAPVQPPSARSFACSRGPGSRRSRPSSLQSCLRCPARLSLASPARPSSAFSPS